MMAKLVEEGPLAALARAIPPAVGRTPAQSRLPGRWSPAPVCILGRRHLIDAAAVRGTTMPTELSLS